MNLHSPPSILKDPNVATDNIIDALREGSLSLVIGSGISKSATDRFPNWIQLVKKCCEKYSIHFDDNLKTSNKYLREQARRVELHCEKNNLDFLETVSSVLYENIEYSVDTMKTNLLISLGSIIMGSVRGSSSVVISYNFDDLLEWYLIYHGFKVQAISKYPCLLEKSDVRVFHPHGFLPNLEKYGDLKSDKIIFSDKSYLQSYQMDSPWNELQISQFSCHLNLFIGFSGDDEHVQTLCQKSYDRVTTNDDRTILGYMVLEDNEKNRNSEELNMDKGIVNYYIESHDHLPEFLLDLCRRSAEM